MHRDGVWRLERGDVDAAWTMVQSAPDGSVSILSVCSLPDVIDAQPVAKPMTSAGTAIVFVTLNIILSPRSILPRCKRQ